MRPYMAKILSISSDSKTVKGEKFGILTGILYLSPYTISGKNLCPKATDGCSKACLYTAGRGKYKNIQDARLKKTKYFLEHTTEFMKDLVKDLESLINKANKNGYRPAARLNGTSDIVWEKIPCARNGITYENVMLAFPEIQFYDYTKILNRKRAIALHNYHLTFSLAENNDKDAMKALEQGYNVAVVMDLKRKDKKPETWGGYPVIDGDLNDARFLDEKGGHIVALCAKGQARKDKSGFVRNPNGGFNKTLSIKMVE